MKKIFYAIRILRAYYHGFFLKTIGSGTNIAPGFWYKKGHNISIGKNTFIGRNTEIDATGGSVQIGNFVAIASGVSLVNSSHNYKDLTIPMIKQDSKKGKIIIEDGAWIGTKAIILPNIIIGKESIVGAGSIVTKNVAEFSIVAGNPAKVIGSRK